MIDFGPFLENHITYDEAWMYCATCTHNNKYDWRIPSQDEFDYVYSLKRVIDFILVPQNSSPWDESDERYSPGGNKFPMLRPIVPVRGHL